MTAKNNDPSQSLSEQSAAAEFRVFPKSWGAEYVRAGEVLFRLWAPDLDAVTLRLDGADTEMTAADEGWFELLATGVVPGARYNFILPDGTCVPDPAARAQDGGIDGPSLVIDPTDYDWQHPDWSGRPFEETVLYELHIGTFTPQGTFLAAIERLEYLRDIGVTAVELMPVAQFPGERGWGYDGVLPYAPHHAYGTPEDMKALIDTAHGLGMMVFLDVVYNHFGPQGNYFQQYAPQFFHPENHTPWGPAIAFERDPVRRFFIENALYWLEEFNLDGLRFDAVHAIDDDRSDTHVLDELAERVRAEVTGRSRHLVTEDSRNVTRFLQRGNDGAVGRYDAVWNDDFHHIAHVIATDETAGYFVDFGDDRWQKFARGLAQGFVYQGEASQHQDGKSVGEPSSFLPPTAFVNFIQNHDQIGNRALGDRLSSGAEPAMIKLLTAILLLAPSIPMIFMGDEYGETQPFQFFTDYDGDLGAAIKKGRMEDALNFGGLPEGVAGPEDLPDPNAPATFERSMLDWSKTDMPEGKARLAMTRDLLQKRSRYVVPGLADAGGNAATILSFEDGVVAIDWQLADRRLQLRANFGNAEAAAAPMDGELIHAQPDGASTGWSQDGKLQPLSMVIAVTEL